MSLQGKVAIITGASRGIGRAIAERLGRDGANVVINYRNNLEKAKEVVRIIEAVGSQAIAVQGKMLGRVFLSRRQKSLRRTLITSLLSILKVLSSYSNMLLA